MAVLDLARDTWRDALGRDADPCPDAVILEGTWWRARAQAQRLAQLDEVRELAFPDIHVGRYRGARVAYCCAYGAARAVEPAHVFAQLGTPLVIQIGTCGALRAGLGAGQVAVPVTAAARDGVSAHYGAGAGVAFDPEWSGLAAGLLARRGTEAVRTRHLTWPSLFAQSDAMCAGWAGEGLETVDMEAAAVAAVAARFGAAAVALLAVWDALPDGKTFLDPLPAPAREALADADRATFAVALELAAEVAQRRPRLS